MKPQKNAVRSGFPESVEAEAAAWIARLHKPDRTPQDEQSFQLWLAENSLHRAAFEDMTNAWDAAGKLKSDVFSRQRLTPLRTEFFVGKRRFWGRSAMALAAALLLAAIGLLFFQDRIVST